MLDVFTRRRIAYRFSTLATTDVAVESLEAVAKPDCSRLILQCDNGSQYAGKKFRKATFGIKLIWKSIPQQNGHIESFRGTIKEYIWPRGLADYQEMVIAAAFRDCNQDALGIQVLPAGEVPNILGGEALLTMCKIVQKPVSKFGVQVAPP